MEPNQKSLLFSKVGKSISIIILSISYICTNCTSPKTNIDDTTCKVYNRKSAEYYSEYFDNSDQDILDSALYYTNKALDTCKENMGLLSLRKLSVLSLQNKFSCALIFINNIDSSMYIDLPYFHHFLELRFMAMKAKYEGDSIRADSCLQIIVKEIGDFITKNKSEIIPLLTDTNINNIIKSPFSTAIFQYYYYKSLVEGKDSVEEELNHKKALNEINNEFVTYLISYLSEDFMNFNGI